ncbi:TATA-box-binding protein 2 [Zea mays]|uniref:TATA-box-binding protein 2 n=2 Tax=Zea mays TaxID=4577 RepID=A0A1D6HZ78_MAIZE|nr:TATA-box-binding protein 2 [Zea mays]
MRFVRQGSPSSTHPWRTISSSPEMGLVPGKKQLMAQSCHQQQLIWDFHEPEQRSSGPFKSPDLGAHGMAGLLSLRAGPRSSPSLARSSSAWASPASQVVVRLTSPQFRCARLCNSRSLLAAAVKISKDGSSAVLANSLPFKGSSFFSYLDWKLEPFQRMFRIAYRAADQCPCQSP